MSRTTFVSIVSAFFLAMMIGAYVSMYRDMKAGKIIRGQYIKEPLTRPVCTSKCYCDAGVR